MMTTRILFFLLFSANVFAHNYGVYKIGKPYDIDGKTYTPNEVSQYSSQGIASWYGKDFDGKNTANGALFNSELRTAAHTILPMPCAVLIRNLDSGVQTVAVVNDRGPFAKSENRIIDVSKKVAEELGFIEAGRANVEIEYLPDLSEKLKNNDDVDIDDYINTHLEPGDDSTKPATITNDININEEFIAAKNVSKSIFVKDYTKNFYVQAGVFQEILNAQNLYKNLSSGVSKMQLRSESQGMKNYYVVRSGPFNTIEEAQVSKKVVDKQCSDCHAMIIII